MDDLEVLSHWRVGRVESTTVPESGTMNRIVIARTSRGRFVLRESRDTDLERLERTHNLIAFVRGCPRVDGVDEIVLPGDPERRTLEKKLAEGIAFDEKNWGELVKLAAKLGVEVPE